MYGEEDGARGEVDLQSISINSSLFKGTLTPPENEDDHVVEVSTDGNGAPGHVTDGAKQSGSDDGPDGNAGLVQDGADPSLQEDEGHPDFDHALDTQYDSKQSNEGSRKRPRSDPNLGNDRKDGAASTDKRSRSGSEQSGAVDGPSNVDTPKGEPAVNRTSFKAAWLVLVARMNHDPSSTPRCEALANRAMKLFERHKKIVMPPTSVLLVADGLSKEARQKIIEAERPIAGTCWQEHIA